MNQEEIEKRHRDDIEKFMALHRAGASDIDILHAMGDFYVCPKGCKDNSGRQSLGMKSKGDNPPSCDMCGEKMIQTKDPIHIFGFMKDGVLNLKL